MGDKRYKMKITAKERGGWRATSINLLVNKNVHTKVLAWKGDSDVVNYLLEYYYYTRYERADKNEKYFSRSQYYKIRDFLNLAYNAIYNYNLIIEIEC